MACLLIKSHSQYPLIHRILYPMFLVSEHAWRASRLVHQYNFMRRDLHHCYMRRAHGTYDEVHGYVLKHLHIRLCTLYHTVNQ
jgi:hypothetical protein